MLDREELDRLSIKPLSVNLLGNFSHHRVESGEISLAVFNHFNQPNFANPNTAFWFRTSSACSFERVLSACERE
jgi:hypothetical protein